MGNGAVNLPPETISDNNNTIPNPDISWLKTDITNFNVDGMVLATSIKYPKLIYDDSTKTMIQSGETEKKSETLVYSPNCRFVNSKIGTRGNTITTFDYTSNPFGS